MLKGKIGKLIQGKINMLTFIELTIIIFTFIYLINFILTICLNYYFNIEELNYDNRLFIMGANSESNVVDSSNTEILNSSISTDQTNTEIYTEANSTRAGNNVTTNIEASDNKSTRAGNNVTTNLEANDTGKNNNSEESARKVGKAIKHGGETVIMAAGVAGGMKLAQASPTLAGKIGFAMAGVGIGGTGIIASKLASKISEDMIAKSSNKYIDLIEPIKDALHFTGNNGIDSLIVIQNFQKIQLFLLFILGYNLLIIYINEKRMEETLLKIMGVNIVNLILNIFQKFKKSAKVIIICCFILLVISNYQAYYYLEFFINNIENIIKLYFK
jgi:hypothetical protein